jgi:hypothetical protein
MDRFPRKIILLLSVGWFFAGEDLIAGNPVGDFFKRLGNSIAHPQHSPTPRPSTRKKTSQTQQNADGQTPSPEAPPTPPPTIPPPTPTPMLARVAVTAPPTKSRRDLPYGIPVPGKPGFVTSPYSPKSGYVDVRGFPSGTEVKDPYSGKTFLTP